MKKKRLIMLVLAGLALAVALTLLLAPREGRRYGKSPSAPDNAFVGPPGPSAADIAAQKAARAAAAVNAALKKAEAARMGRRRKKRVSRLREPGDAMGGGVRLTLTDKRPGLVKKK